MESAQQLETKTGNQITEFNEFESKLQTFKSKYEGTVYDLTDEGQEKQAKSDRLTIGKVIASLDRTHREIKAPLKERTDLIDHERKRIKDDLLLIQGSIKDQIEAHDQKIADHAQMLGDKVQAIIDLAEFGEFEKPDSESLKARLVALKALDIDDSYEFRKADATLAEVDAVKKLSKLLADAMKSEAEQAELERLRKESAEREQREHEERIKQEAAEQAKRQAEAQAEQAAKTEQERVEREQREAQEAARREIEAAKQKQREAEQAAERAAQDERERIEQEQREAQAQADAVKGAEDKKKARQNYRSRIHKEAKESFIAAGFNHGTDLVTAIKDDLIKHIKIEY